MSVLLALFMTVPTATAVNFDVCALTESLPAAKDPAALAPPFKRAFVALASTPPHQKKMAKLHKRFARPATKLLRQAMTLFLPSRAERSQAKIRRFLKRHVFHPTPSLIVDGDGFDLTPAVRAALAYTACRAGDLDRAIRHARRPRLKPAALIAYAAALLIRQGKREVAAELVPALDGRGFLAPWVLAELAAKAADRDRYHRVASNRALTSVQREAVARQVRWRKAKKKGRR